MTVLGLAVGAERGMGLSLSRAWTTAAVGSPSMGTTTSRETPWRVDADPDSAGSGDALPGVPRLVRRLERLVVDAAHHVAGLEIDVAPLVGQAGEAPADELALGVEHLLAHHPAEEPGRPGLEGVLDVGAGGVTRRRGGDAGQRLRQDLHGRGARRGRGRAAGREGRGGGQTEDGAEECGHPTNMVGRGPGAK